ncbi:MAG: hypothetical protein J7L82_04555, partial [Staphylothermus sp.]|nr:hypothetical protein [Staphylothermus sp.]
DILLNILALSRIYGNKIVSSIIKYVVKSLSIDLIIFVGDTVSPRIIYDIYKSTRVKVMGIPGIYDDVSVIKALKDINGFLDGHFIELNNIKIAGIGVSIDSSINSLMSKIKVLDLLVSYYLGRKHNPLGTNGLAKIDKFIDNTKPKFIIFSKVGEKKEKCVHIGQYIYPGNGFRGYFTVLTFSHNSLLEKVRCYDIYSFL